MTAKIIAWHLPQFHAIKENDEWWGPGFTEWTQLRRWKPVYPGHQIRRPHPDVGEYCLLEQSARQNQAEMARAHGVYGFCYYHYWFSGTLLLQQPLERMLEDGRPDLPFCLSWANEPWSRRWNGLEREILMGQDYGGPDEWARHLDYLLPFFRHRNYIQVDGKPMFLVYRLGKVPDYQARFRFWEERLREAGFRGLHLVMTLSGQLDNWAPLPNADAVVEFFPNRLDYGRPLMRWLERHPKMKRMMLELRAFAGPLRYDGREAYDQIVRLPQVHDRQYRGLFTGWDNSPRVGRRARMFQGITPELFGRCLRTQLQRTSDFVFINAWNEWAEGATLEPDDQFGYDFLETIASIA